eukprot:TRINITY_DN278_c0_g1_i1.p1 TRINITY_DN278_c0_g1~~TRINITY_DN278_c0_g1_i1.p1  ORF type:complete len:586 (-),score=245.05 TRINITY_DN278_c0_g1_i1:380-2137(-)
MPKTTSGKVQRFECRNLLKTNTFRPARRTFRDQYVIFYHAVLSNLTLFMIYFWIQVENLLKKCGVSGNAGKSGKNAKTKGGKFEKILETKPKETFQDEFKLKSSKIAGFPDKLEDSEELKKMRSLLISLVEKGSKIPNLKVEINTPLYEYGFTSMDAVQLCSALKPVLRKTISPTILYEFYTIDLLARALVDPNADLSREIVPKAIDQGIRNFEREKATILGMGTANPENIVTQEMALGSFLEFSNTLKHNPDSVKKITKLFEGSSMEKRFFTIPPSQLVQVESTEERNKLYIQHAPKLAFRAATKAIENWGGDRQKITHVVSVSCTGTIVPGLEFQLVQDLKLNPNCMRLGVNFMGCFGGLTGLRTAMSISLSDPSYVVLLVCTELCSLHVQKDDLRIDNFVASSLFGDGSAAAIVGSPKSGIRNLFQVERASCFALPDSQDRICWDLSNTGYIVGLKPDIGFQFGKFILPFVDSLSQAPTEKAGNGESPSQSRSASPYEEFEWCIHPGGKAIVELIEHKLGITSEENAATWKVYRDFGNMSSATVLFVLEELTRVPESERKKKIVSLAFGPGLSVEGMLLTRM